MNFFRKIFGSSNSRKIKKLQLKVVKINSLEKAYSAFTDEELSNVTADLMSRYSGQGESLDTLLPEAFAAVREAGKRTLGLRHFDVQLVGGMVLHEGNIAEMRTGEGKTLMSTLPAYLNADRKSVV